MTSTDKQRFSIVNANEIDPVRCPCGMTRRVFTDDPDKIPSLHVVDITEDAQTHYHKQITELYYVLAGTGQMELDGQLFVVVGLGVLGDVDDMQ